MEKVPGFWWDIAPRLTELIGTGERVESPQGEV